MGKQMSSELLPNRLVEKPEYTKECRVFTWRRSVFTLNPFDQMKSVPVGKPALHAMLRVVARCRTHTRLSIANGTIRPTTDDRKTLVGKEKGRVGFGIRISSPPL